jgi:hypothetical protein
MEDKIIVRIKCPQCGAVLKIEVSPSLDLTKGKLTCPSCKAKSPLADYNVVSNIPVPDDTQILAPLHDTIGHLIDEYSGKEYVLREGVQLVGRMSIGAKNKADVLIETDDRGFSRSQFFLRIISGPDGRYHTYISEASHSNPTSLNGRLLVPGDEFGLHHNDLITASETSLRFKGTYIDDSTELMSLTNKG